MVLDKDLNFGREVAKEACVLYLEKVVPRSGPAPLRKKKLVRIWDLIMNPSVENLNSLNFWEHIRDTDLFPNNNSENKSKV